MREHDVGQEEGHQPEPEDGGQGDQTEETGYAAGVGEDAGNDYCD